MRNPVAGERLPVDSTLNRLPSEMNRARVLSSAQAAELTGFSLSHFRRLCRSGKVPKPVQLGGRKLGWRFGALVDWIEAESNDRAA